ncbi:hypothetical protein Q9R32_15440 [Actinotalea sp. AC32]|nr:hypothetical protein [Actinotalea sp. AC32]
MTTTAQPRLDQQRVVLSLHGVDPSSRTVATWHVTCLADDGAPGTYLIERAEGDISNPAVWMQAHRDAATAGEDDVIALVRTVFLAGGSAH